MIYVREFISALLLTLAMIALLVFESFAVTYGGAYLILWLVGIPADVWV